MEASCIRHTDLPGTSRLFSDFAYHFNRVSQFYDHPPANLEVLTSAAGAIDYPADRRAAMVAALKAQNGDSASLRMLAQPGTVAVVTGQQVGLFSGPAYTIYKALTAAKMAADLSEHGVPAVPVFWLATEDHDFPEVDHVYAFGPAHQPEKLTVSGNHAELQPVGSVEIVKAPIEELRSLLAGFPYADEVMALAAESYAPGQTLGSAFRSLLKGILGKFGLLFLDPLEPAIRKIGAPFLAEALKQAPELKKQLLQRNKELADAGYHSQVLIEPKSSLFFLLEDGKRIPVKRKDEDFASLAGDAEHVSPNALLRPVMQDYLLPTVAYIGGPAELAYLAQSQVIYDSLLGRMPVVTPRSGFTLLDYRAQKLLTRYGLNVVDTFDRPDVVRQRIAQKLTPPSVSQLFAETESALGAKLGHLEKELLSFDPTLADALRKSQSKITHQFHKLASKAALETMRRDERAGDDAQFLIGLLYPHRHLQERFYTILPFLAKHGLDLVDTVYANVHLDCPDHKVLVV
ncbi:MAG: bacillithiol biosynthesis cysteine-adding enzyme BshC [Bryobacteraceae bacterium]